MVVEKWWDISITGFLAFGVWQDVELVMIPWIYRWSLPAVDLSYIGITCDDGGSFWMRLSS